MALTLAQLAGALRLGNGVDDPVEPIAGRLNRALGVATELVTVTAPDSPEAVFDEAVARIAAFLYDANPASTGDRFAFAMRSQLWGAFPA